ncbi:hypothetical protein BDP27DRAFT_1345064, partial [Rhodocollybia butyracea]
MKLDKERWNKSMRSSGMMQTCSVMPFLLLGVSQSCHYLFGLFSFTNGDCSLCVHLHSAFHNIFIGIHLQPRLLPFFILASNTLL